MGEESFTFEKGTDFATKIICLNMIKRYKKSMDNRGSMRKIFSMSDNLIT